MENIYDIGGESYVPAEPLRKQTISEKIEFALHFTVDLLKVWVLSIPLWFIAIYRLFVSRSKKSVVGQTVLVTGGGNGIGKEIAIRFAGKGCNIAIADIDFSAAENTAKELNESKTNIIARAYHVDITDINQIMALKVNIEKDMAPVDILVNNAGIIPLLSLREGTEKDIERIIQVNVTGHLLMTRTFLSGMIERRRGHIVGIASMIAIHAMPGAILYSTTKAAMHNFIMSLNEEMRQEGNECIKCTSILPNMVSTRKDVVDASKFPFSFISPQYTAKVAVDAILRDELLRSIPGYHSWPNYALKLLPVSIQMLYRDILYKEKGNKLFSKDNKRQV